LTQRELDEFIEMATEAALRDLRREIERAGIPEGHPRQMCLGTVIVRLVGAFLHDSPKDDDYRGRLVDEFIVPGAVGYMVVLDELAKVTEAPL
jgi:hypothetical protein